MPKPRLALVAYVASQTHVAWVAALRLPPRGKVLLLGMTLVAAAGVGLGSGMVLDVSGNAVVDATGSHGTAVLGPESTADDVTSCSVQNSTETACGSPVDESQTCVGSETCIQDCAASIACGARGPVCIGNVTHCGSPEKSPANGTYSLRAYDEAGRAPSVGTCLPLHPGAKGSPLVDGLCAGSSPPGLTSIQVYVYDPATGESALWGRIEYSIPEGDHVDLPPLYRQNAYFLDGPTPIPGGLAIAVFTPPNSPGIHVECISIMPDGSAPMRRAELSLPQNGTLKAACETMPGARDVHVFLYVDFQPHAEKVDTASWP